MLTPSSGSHNPPQDAELKLLNEFRHPAQIRLIFDEFFWLECGLAFKKNKAREASGISFSVTPAVREQIKLMLPFKPTASQRKVMQEIADDMKRPHPMNRLLQGRRGQRQNHGGGPRRRSSPSRTATRWRSSRLPKYWPAQHYAYFSRLLEKIGYSVALLTGSARDKRQTKKLIEDDLVKAVVGTHALLQEDVKFANLGLAIVDEQHRFGVRQRLGLMRKGEQPDVLAMTATPIPRTLALTVYGDLDVSTIDELPPGRKPVVTKHVTDSAVEGVYSFLAQEVKAGRQAYVVYPLVEETENHGRCQSGGEDVPASVREGLLWYHGKAAARPDEFRRQRGVHARLPVWCGQNSGSDNGYRGWRRCAERLDNGN